MTIESNSEETEEELRSVRMRHRTIVSHPHHTPALDTFRIVSKGAGKSILGMRITTDDASTHSRAYGRIL
jgi:hypothetical protein